MPEPSIPTSAPASEQPSFRPLPPPPPLWRRALDWVRSHRDQLPVSPRSAAAGVAVVVVVVAILVLTVRATGASGARPELALPRAAPASPSTSAADVAVVYVVGAVQHPGLYRLPPSARVGDAVDAAGGATDEADLDSINLAAEVGDGDRVYVPRQGDNVDTGGDPAGDASPPQTLHLNTASAADLEALPGVGPSLANAIVEYRRQHGRFQSVDGLLEVPGIGPAKLAALRTRLKL